MQFGIDELTAAITYHTASFATARQTAQDVIAGIASALATGGEVRLPGLAPDRAARRYMTKKFVRDLWKAWRAAGNGLPERAGPVLPPATLAG